MDRDIAIEILRRLQFDVTPMLSSTRDNYTLSCIDHSDRRPSFSVNIEKGIYHCFSCGIGGTLTSLYFDRVGSSIWKDLGISRDGPSLFSRAFNTMVPKLDYDLTPDNSVAFEGDLVRAWDSKIARAYLIRRGITKDVADQMNMFYAISGLVRDLKDVNDEENFTRYDKRLVIPIRENGTTLSIEGRDILGESAYTGDPSFYRKVLYPKGSSTSTLFQYEKLDKTKPVYFTEGLMDLGPIRTCKFFKNSTTIFGATVTHRQVYLLNKFLKIVDLMDNDLAGWEALLKLGKGLERLESGASKKLFYVVPPKGAKDPGDIVQKLHMTIQECYDKKGFAREVAWNEATITSVVEKLRKDKELERARRRAIEAASKEFSAKAQEDHK